MKKYLLLSTALLSLSAVPAFAEHHEMKDGSKKGLFEKHDTNADGVVTQDEYLAHAKTRFTELDTDKDGKITKAESDAHKAEWKEKMKERRETMKEKAPLVPTPAPAPVQ
jgi:hypothetical protein